MKKYFLSLSVFLIAILGYSQAVVFQEGFETQPYSVTGSGSPAWSAVTNLYYEGTHSYRNQLAMDATAYLTTNSFSTTGNSYVSLSFAHICKIEVADTAAIEVSVDGGVTWQKLTTTHYEGSGTLINGYAFSAMSYNPDWQPINSLVAPTNDWWRVETFDISSIAANKSDVRVRFRVKDGNSNGGGGAAGWYLDDIKVVAAASELTPPTITLLSPIYQDTVLNNPGPYTIKASITDASGIQTARLIWSINNGAPDSVDMTNTSGSTYEGIIPAQAYNTRIDYTVKAIDASPANNVATVSKWFFTKRVLIQDITIGTGTGTTQYNPVYSYWGYNYTQQIYAASEITAAGGTPGGQIYKIKFHWNGSGNLTNADVWTIYMGNTSKTSFSSNTDWVPLSSMTEVYTGQVTLPPSAGWVTITLTTPFTWDGNNLVIAVDENVPSYGSTAYWYCTSTSPNYQAIYYRSDSNNPDPASPPSASGRSYNRPNVQLTFEIPSHDNDVQFIAITEPSGVLYSTNQYNIKGKFKNIGNNALTSFTIKYKINGVEQTPYSWTGTMLTDEEREITFATGVSFSAGPVVIEAWTENPNGVNDENQSNDTANVSLHCCTAGFSGTYTIDSSQPTGGTNFNNVADAFTEIGTCGMIGPVTIELVDTLYQGSIILGEVPGLSPTNTLTIKPQNGKQVTIESDDTYYTVQLLATHDIIIDGSGDGSGSRDLTIKHTATSGSHTPIHIASSGVGQGCERITIKNVNIEAGRNGSTTSGIFIGGSTSATASGEDNDSIVIDNVNIQKAYYGIYAYGKSANPAKRIYITNSSFGSDSTDSFITQRGVYLYYANNVLVNNNHIYNITTSSSTPQGIYLYHSDTATVMNNIIHSVKYTGTSGYGGHGIESYYSNNALIANNMIYDMQGDGWTSITASSMAGIVIRYSNENKVYFNSVNLFGDYTRSNATITSAFFADASSSELDVRNNIFANSMINTGNTSAKAYAIYSLASPSAYTFLDYNDYYVSGLQGVLGYFNSADQTTLASLQAATGKDVHSINIDPEFISNTDLHTFNTDLSSMGTPIAGISTDIDGDPRYPIPSIGADEVELLPINLKLASIDNTIHGCEYSGNTPVKFTVVNMGTTQITTFDASYILDAETPVTQIFATNLNSFDAAQFTFNANITIDPTIEHSLRVYVSCANDANRNNDTLDIMISDVYNLVASPYTMSFELTEPYGYFSALDLGNDGYSWVFPSTGNAHSGSNSAVYNNSTTNSHGDWLFSRCFELTAGETYEVSFWYKASSASDNHVMYLGISPTPDDTINLINIDNISAINNTTYSQHTKRFIAPTTGTYYIGWGMYSPHANNKLYLDDINISWVPAQDIKMLEVTSPVTACGLGVENIQVKGLNNGTNLISNFTISYQIAGNLNVVTETYTGTVAPLDTFTYTFAATEDFSAPLQNLEFTIIAWTDLSGDPIAYNDTIEYSFISRFTPVEPVVYNETILSGTSATLTAYNESPDVTNLWYSDILGTTLLHIGNTYITPTLTDTTIYYVKASSSGEPVIIGDMNSSTNTYYIPFYGLYDYGYSSMIYLSSEIGGSGLIDTIAFYVTNTPSNYIMTDQRIYFKERAESAFYSSETSLPDTTTMTRVFKGNITFNGSGWHKIPLQTPFYYTGNNHLQITYINNDGDYVSGYPYFMSTSTTSARGLYKYQDNSLPTTGGTLVNYYPNIRISMSGCSSGIVADTVFVVDSTEYELAIDDVIYPENMECVTSTTNVSIRLRNDGYEVIPAGIGLTCIVNGDTLTGITAGPILPDSTIDYTFTTPININFVESGATLDFKVYHSAPQYSLTVFNDTLLKSIGVQYQPDAPVAHSCVTLAGLPALLSVDPQAPAFHNWYSDSLGENLLSVGDTFMTPPLYDTTIYYVSAVSGSDQIIVGDMNSTTTTYYIPFYGLYNYGYSSMIYLSSEIGGGLIDTIAFYVTNDPSNYIMTDQRIYFKERTTSAFGTSETSLPDTTTMTRVFKGNITFNGSGWHKIALQTPFNYTGNNHLQITYINNDGSWTSGYPNFKTTTVTGNRGLYKYQDASLPTTGGSLVTYVPNLRISKTGCSSDIVADTAYVLPSAPYELAIEEIVYPIEDGCVEPSTNITVKLHNYGEEQLPSDIELTCIINNTDTITESIHYGIGPDEDYNFTFTDPINLNFLDNIADISLKIYHNGAPTYSLVTYNDTIKKHMRLYARAANPIVASSTIDFGDIDTLIAHSPDGLPIYWYSDPNGSNLLNVGDTLITPHLLDTTIYYVSSGPYSVYGMNPKEIGDMNSTTTTYYIPFYGFYNYGYSSMIYLSSEIGGGGLIDTIAFYVTNDPSNYQVLDQRIYFKERTTPAFGSSETSLPDTTTMTRVFKGNITFNGNGWHKIPLQTPFYYTGNNHLQITYINNDGSYESGYPYFKKTDVTGNRGLYKYQDASLPTTDGTLVTYVPNIYISISGCSSELVADTVYVINFPQYELAVEQLVYPIHGACTEENVNIKVRLHNYGYDTIPAGASITCVMDGTDTITDITTEEILPHNDYILTFTPQLTIPFVGGQATIDLEIYPTDLTYSTLTYNDTISKTLDLRLQPDDPIAINDTVPLLTSATLTAIHQTGTRLLWYSDSLGTNQIYIGDTLHTPILYDTTVYYVKATSSSDPIIVGDMSSTSETYYMPTNGLYNFGYSSMIYLSSEIGQGGLIDTIAFYVTNNPSNHQMLDQRVYITETSSAVHSSSDLPDTTTMTRVFKGDLTFNGNGWYKVALQTPFNYTGTDNLQIVWLNYDGDWVSGYPKFKYTNVTGNRGLYKSSDGSFPTTSGTLLTYVPNLRLSISGCNSNIVPVTAYVIFPPYELAVEELIAPAAGECIESNTNVTVRLKNYGTDTIPAGVDMTCVLNSTDTITGTTTEQILPNSTIDFTFPTNVTIPFVNNQALAHFELYHNNPAYTTVTFNDTLLVDVNLMQMPDAPIVSSQTINYGEMATLSATSPSGAPIVWYSDPLGQNMLHVGNTYITPRIYSNTIYYLAAVSAGDVIVGDMNSTSETNYLPTNGWYNYSYSSMIYLSSEIGQGGLIDTIAFYVTNNPSNYQMLDQRVYITETALSSHSSSDFPDTTTMQRVFIGDLTFNGNGWHKVALQTPFNYLGTDNLQIVWLNYDGSYSSGYPKFKYTNVTGNRGLYKYQDGSSFPTTSGTLVTYVPNIYLSISGCSSEIVSDTVYVTNMPDKDVGIAEITKPSTGIELTDEEVVKVVIRNFTQNDLNNATFDVAYQIDNQVPVVEQFTGSIAAQDTVSFTFTQTVDLSIIGNTYSMIAYTDYDLDGFIFNDTLQKTITNKPLEYCTSTATYTGDEDICRVKVGDFENISGYTMAMYTDFTHLDGPLLFIGEQYVVEVDECDEVASYYAGYARVFIDWNHDGEYQVPEEVVLESYYPNTSYNTLVDSFTVPTDAYIGYTGMRVVVREGTDLPDPCGTYGYGETEDYLVLVLPRKAIDAGVTAANVGYAQYEGTTTIAEVKVRNYGYNPLTSFDLITKKDGQVISTTPWSGNLQPDATVTITVSDIPVTSELNNVCFTVQAPNDSIPQNDTRCTQYFGLPSVILFADDMEPTTSLTADASGLWEHGVPQGTVINQAYSAPNVWMTKLAELYPNDTIGYLEFPVMNFSGVTDPYLSFYYWVESESGEDGAYIEYSLNNGQTWITLGGVDDPEGYNWYTDYLTNGKSGFSGSSDGWVGAFYKMSALSNKTNVMLRIGFVSDASVNADGFAIDNIVISAYNVPNNVALAEIVTPTSPTTTGSTQTVEIKIANVGTNVVTNVPVSYKINSGTAVNGTYSGSIEPGDTVTYTFTQTYLAPHLDYTLCAYSRYPSDIVRINDTLCMFIESLPAAYDIGVLEIVSPRDSTPTGQPVQVTIAVKNYGTNAVSNIPVRYQLNYANDRNDIIAQTIEPGDTIHFTFTQTYNGPIIQYVLCAETQLSTDEYTPNDGICEILGTYVVGIEDMLEDNEGLVIYPNPSTGELNILLETTKSSEGVLIIRNPLGELVYSENISVSAGKNELRLDLSHQATGLYHCTLMIGDRVYNRVISIQR